MNFTADWFSQNLIDWERELAPMKLQSGKRFLEIGSFEGKSTCWFLENILTGEGDMIHCVDPFPGVLLDRFQGNVSQWSSRVKTRLDEAYCIWL